MTLNGGGWSARTASIVSIFGAYYKNQTSTQSVVISWTGRALYASLVSGSNLSCSATVSTDGGATQWITSANSSPNGTTNLFRIPTLLARNLQDTSHTTTITISPLASETDYFYIEGAYSISGGKQTVTPGQVTFIGNSWTIDSVGATGNGAFTQANSWVRSLPAHIAAQTKQPVTFTTCAVSGARLIAGAAVPTANMFTQFIGDYYTFNCSSCNATAGCTYTNNGKTFTVVNTVSGSVTLVCTGTGSPQASGTLTKGVGTGDATITFSTVALQAVATSALSTSPQYLCIQMGENDLRNSAGMLSGNDFLRIYRTMLCLIEDTLDVYGTYGPQVRVSVGTPGYINPNYTYAILQSNGVTGGSTQYTGINMYESAVAGIRRLVNEFPWLVKIADVYGAMDRKVELLMPNGRADGGLHPNDIGHSVIESAHASALLVAGN